MARRQKASATEIFLKAFGQGTPYRSYTKADDKRLAKRIPKVMREILQKQGWCSYKEQVLWICDPDDWQAAANAWFPDAKNRLTLARTAFGDLFVWDGDIYWFALVHESFVMSTVDNDAWFFSQMLPAPDFAPQTYLPKDVRAARKTAGPLEWNEMYSYVPALALGGSETSSRIERVKALEAIVLLAGLAPIRRR